MGLWLQYLEWPLKRNHNSHLMQQPNFTSDSCTLTCTHSNFSFVPLSDQPSAPGRSQLGLHRTRLPTSCCVVTISLLLLLLVTSTFSPFCFFKPLLCHKMSGLRMRLPKHMQKVSSELFEWCGHDQRFSPPLLLLPPVLRSSHLGYHLQKLHPQIRSRHAQQAA